jgi:hypothetical protein
MAPFLLGFFIPSGARDPYSQVSISLPAIVISRRGRKICFNDFEGLEMARGFGDILEGYRAPLASLGIKSLFRCFHFFRIRQDLHGGYEFSEIRKNIFLSNVFILE